MKSIWRGALAALATSITVLGLLVPGASRAFAAPVPLAPNPDLINTWANVSPSTAFLQNIVISKNASGGVLVDAFKNCTPGCELGNVPAILYAANVNAATGNSFQASIVLSQSSVDILLLGTFTLLGDTQYLTVQEFVTAFNENRFNWVGNETFMPAAAPITPQVSGVSQTGYPLGNAATPANAFAVTWKNFKFDGGIERIAISGTAGGLGVPPIAIDVVGFCNPGMCDWGLAQMVSTYGTSINGTAPVTFLAFYKLWFANVLLSGTISNGGKFLTVSTYTQFTDNSGRPNYMMNETFGQ